MEKKELSSDIITKIFEYLDENNSENKVIRGTYMHEVIPYEIFYNEKSNEYKEAQNKKNKIINKKCVEYIKVHMYNLFYIEYIVGPLTIEKLNYIFGLINYRYNYSEITNGTEDIAIYHTNRQYYELESYIRLFKNIERYEEEVRLNSIKIEEYKDIKREKKYKEI